MARHIHAWYLWVLCCLPTILLAADALLHEAVRLQDGLQIKQLLSANTPIDVLFGDDKITVLHLAAAYGDQALVEAYIARGAQIDAITKSSETPLMWAAAHGNESTARTLLAYGARLDIQNPEAMNALHFAIAHQKNNLVPVFIEAGLPFDINAFYVAAMFNNIPMLAYTLSLGLPIDGDETIPFPPLYLAIGRGNLEAVQFLVEHGSDLKKIYAYKTQPETLNQWMHTNAFMLAAAHNKPVIMEYLFQKGEDPYALGYVTAPNLPKMVVSIFTIAATSRAWQALEWLCQHGYSWNFADCQGNTALQNALLVAATPEIQNLLSKGIDINHANVGGQTSLHMAALIARTDVCTLFIAQGAHIDACTKDNATPLTYAAMMNNTEVADLLLSCGANALPRTTDENKTARDFAKENRNIRLYKHLLYHETHKAKELGACPFCNQGKNL